MIGTGNKILAGNWKMNGTRQSLQEAKLLAAANTAANPILIVCPPATLLAAVAEIFSGTHVQAGGQDCHPRESGAYTGEVSAEMLADSGASCVIVGHSERRDHHGETSAAVRRKAEAALRAGLTAIVCIGETDEERSAGDTLGVVDAQLEASVPDSADGSNLVVAYEPVWAIGTGKTASTGDIGEVHSFIRSRLQARFGEAEGKAFRLLYGGSVNPGNAEAIFSVAEVDGGLVGGASLKADSLLSILQALKS